MGFQRPIKSYDVTIDTSQRKLSVVRVRCVIVVVLTLFGLAMGSITQVANFYYVWNKKHPFLNVTVMLKFHWFYIHKHNAVPHWTDFDELNFERCIHFIKADDKHRPILLNYGNSITILWYLCFTVKTASKLCREEGKQEEVCKLCR